MAKICTKKIDTDAKVVVFAFTNGDSHTVALADFPDDIKTRFALHGISQKLGDSYASADGIDEAIEAFLGTLETTTKGDWSTRAAGGGKGRTTMLAEALAEATGQDLDAAVAVLAEQTDEGKKAIKAHPQVRAILERISAERAAAKAAKAAKAAEETDAPDLGGMFG